VVSGEAHFQTVPRARYEIEQVLRAQAVKLVVFEACMPADVDPRTAETVAAYLDKV
jgi:hypothetical protein